MKRRLGCFSWVVVALVLVGAIQAGVGALNLLWYGPGYAGALAARHAPERVRAASRVHVYDHVIVVERDRVIFRRSTWASARFAVLVGFAASIGMLVLRRKGAVVLLAGIVAAGAAFAVAYARTRDVVVARGSPGPVSLVGDSVVLGDVVLLHVPPEDDGDARRWRDVVAEKIAARP